MAAAAGGAGPDFGELTPAGQAPAAADPKSLVRQVAQASSWEIKEDGEIFHLTIPVGSLRKQNVTVDFSKTDSKGHSVISYTSTCGPASEKNALALLRYNTKMMHGAFAIQSTDSGEFVVVSANQLADTLDPLEVTRVVTAVAWQADKAEEKLMGGDQF